MSSDYFRSLKSFIVATFPTLETTDRFLPNLVLIYKIGSKSNLCFFFPTATGIGTDGKRLRDVETILKLRVCMCVCVLRFSIKGCILLPKLIK